MNKFSLSKSPINLACNNLLSLAIIVLILLVTFNLGWLLMLINLYTRSNIVINTNKTILNFESFLLFGNLGILLLFIAYAWGMKNLRDFLDKLTKN